MMAMQIERFRLNRSGVFVPFVRDGGLHQVAVAPMPGPQYAYMCAPEREVGIVGNRGGGKTQIMLTDALSGVGRGWGNAYKMILLRRSQREFTDILTWLVPLVKTIWPKSDFNKLKNIFTWPTGETLELSYYDSEADWSLYQGKQYAVIMWEELTLWENSKPYLSMFSCLRSVSATVPRKVRFTANPSGVGHGWVKFRFRLHGIPTGLCGPCIKEVGEDGIESSRRVIYASFDDNALLKRTEPGYMRDVEIACEGDSARLQAWKYGSWDIVSGGGFDEIFFTHGKHIFVEPFDLPAEGQLFISYDHGDSKPCAVLFWWESRGCDIRLKNGRLMHTRPGDLFLIGEVYLWSGRPNEGIKPSIADITTAIQSYKMQRGWRYRDPLSQKWVDLFKRRTYADSQIFSDVNEFNIAEEFKKPVRINGEQHPGIEWQPVEKPPNSRRDGFTLMRERLLGTAPRAGSNVRESPGLFVVREACPQWARVIPTLPRDKKNPDVIDEKSEDHLFDCTRYGLAADRSAHVRFDRRQVW